MNSGNLSYSVLQSDKKTQGDSSPWAMLAIFVGIVFVIAIVSMGFGTKPPTPWENFVNTLYDYQTVIYSIVAILVIVLVFVVVTKATGSWPFSSDDLIGSGDEGSNADLHSADSSVDPQAADSTATPQSSSSAQPVNTQTDATDAEPQSKDSA